jgi:hypothetical protein
MGGCGDTAFAGEGVFPRDLNADLHRGPADVVDRRLEHDLIADTDGLLEDQRIDPCGDDLTAAVPLCRHRRDHVDPRDDSPAEGGPLWIRLRRHHQIPRLDRTLTRCFALYVHHALHSATTPSKSQRVRVCHAERSEA